MTYIVGWVANGAAHLVADSLLTGRQGIREATSFGESTRNLRGESFEECAFKLSALGPRTLAAFSGSERLGNHCIEFLKENIRSFASISELFQAASVSLGQDGDSVDIVLADATAGRASITVWNSAVGICPTQGVVQVGTASAFHRFSLNHFIEHFSAKCRENALLLQCVVAYMQSFCISDTMGESNIGGVMVGASVHAGGIAFQDDVTYVLCGPERLAGMVLVRVREGAAIIYSSVTGEGLVLANAQNTPVLDAWTSRWMPRYRAMVRKPEAPFIGIIATHWRNALLVHHTPTKHPRELFFERDGANTHIRVTGELAHAIAERPREAPLSAQFAFAYWPQPPL